MCEPLPVPVERRTGMPRMQRICLKLTITEEFTLTMGSRLELVSEALGVSKSDR